MNRTLIRAAAISLCTSVSLFAQTKDPRASITVSTAWVAEHLKDPDLVLLHVGEKPEFDAAHLPGARYVALQDISVSDRVNPNALVLEVPSPTDLHDRLAALGIGDKSRVIVYFGKDWVSPSTRVLFTLDYAGLGNRSALMEGGMPQWKAENRAVTAETPVVTTAALSPLKIRPIVVDAAWVNAHRATPGISIVDSRDTVFYLGIRAGGRPPAEQRAGHIAGAKSVFFGSLYEQQTNMLKPATELRALFTAAGVQPGDTVVTYCHIGQQATATLFAARSLGHPVLLYDGSYEDWSRRTELPVENPAKKPN